jgi:hypothetical protein
MCKRVLYGSSNLQRESVSRDCISQSPPMVLPPGRGGGACVYQ